MSALRSKAPVRRMTPAHYTSIITDKHNNRDCKASTLTPYVSTHRFIIAIDSNPKYHPHRPSTTTPISPSPKLNVEPTHPTYWLHFCHCTYTICLNFKSVESVVSKPVALEFVLVRRIWLLMLSRLPLLPQGDMTVDVLSASSCLR